MYQYPRPRDRFVPNQRGIYNYDARNVHSGKDAMIFDEEGILLATVDTFQAKMNIATTTYQPLGSINQQSFVTGYSATIAITQCIVESDRLFREILYMTHKGRHAPHWTLQSVMYGYEGSEEHIIWRDCIPEGDWDIHNFTIGDIIKRTLNLHCQQPPELLRQLTYEQ